MKKLLFILLLTIPFIGFGQSWETTFGSQFGDDMGYSVQQTTDGGYIITGFTTSFNNEEFYLIKTDGNGVEQWSQTFDNGIGYDVKQTTDGGYIICGRIDSLSSYSNLYLIKTDGNGVEQWNQSYGGTFPDQGFSVQQTTDGGYIICGGTNNGVDSDVYLIKTDGNGVEQWSQTFGVGNNVWGRSVQQTTDGGYIICGNRPFDIYLIKTDGNGDSLWTKVYDGSDPRSFVQQTTDGGYIITGSTYVSGNHHDVYLIKTDGNGDSLWSKTFGGIDIDRGFSVQQTTDGGYIITGSTRSFGNGNHDVYLIKTDGNGVGQWYQTFGGIFGDWGNSVKQTTDGGYIITGCTYDGVGSDVYLIKTDSQGNITSTFNIPTPNSTRKLEKIVDILGRETKPQTNTPFIEIYDDGSIEKKIVVE